MSNRSLTRGVVVGVVVLAGALAACVGDSPYAGTPDDPDASPAAPASSSSSSGTPGGGDAGSTSPDHDSGSNAPTDAAAAQDSSTPTDASMLPDTAPAPVACSEPLIPPGAFNFRCSAAAAAITAGGSIPIGTYLLTRYWDSTCVYQIGWGEVFTQGGVTYLRYERIQRAMASDVGTKSIGTVRLDAAAGAVDRTEVCDAATLGTTTSGRYEVLTTGASPVVTLSFADHQERWTKQ